MRSRRVMPAFLPSSLYARRTQSSLSPARRRMSAMRYRLRRLARLARADRFVPPSAISGPPRVHACCRAPRRAVAPVFRPFPHPHAAGPPRIPVMPCTETLPLRRRPATCRHFRLAGGGSNPVDGGSRLPILSGQARGGTMSFADIGSIVGGIVVLGLIGYFMYVKVLKH